eukprot:6182548-Pleurochrysis_carterae.AAC.3
MEHRQQDSCTRRKQALSDWQAAVDVSARLRVPGSVRAQEGTRGISSRAADYTDTVQASKQ